MNTHFDGWEQVNASLGTVRQRAVTTAFTNREALSDADISSLYRQDPYVARIVDRIVDDALRPGFQVTGITDRDGNRIEVDQKKLQQKFKDLGLMQALRRAAKWSRKDGAALLMLPAYDGQTLDLPLSVGPNQPLLPFSVVPKCRARPGKQDVGLNSPTYGRVLRYFVQGLVDAEIEIHHSRCIRFEPLDLPIEELERYGDASGWGPGVIERVFDDLARDGATTSHAVTMMYISSVLFLQLNKLRTEMTTKGGPERVEAFMRSVSSRLTSQGILTLDGEDKIGAVQRAVPGAHELVTLMRNRLAASAEMPREILYNESPAGLNAGELSGPQAIWFARCESWRDDQIDPAIDTILGYVFASMGIGAVSWQVEWHPFWVRSDEASAEVHSKNAAADGTYISMGVLTSDEVRDARFVDGTAGPIEITEDARDPDALELTPADFEAQSQAETPAAEDGMAGPQIASLVDILRAFNSKELSYQQAKGVLELSFPSLRGRSESVLGPPLPDTLTSVPEPAVSVPSPEADASTAPMPEDVVSVQEAAAKVGVPTRTLTVAMQRGDLPYWQFGGRRQVSLAAVLELGKRHEIPPEPPVDGLAAQ